MMIKRLLLVVFVFFPCLLNAADNKAATIAEVLIQNEAVGKAYEANDVELLDVYLSENHKHTNVFGKLLNKQELLNDIRTGKLKFFKYIMSDTQVDVYGDVAVLTGKIAAVVQRDGQDVGQEFRFTRVFVKEDYQWKELAFHNTKVAKP